MLAQKNVCAEPTPHDSWVQHTPLGSPKDSAQGRGKKCHKKDKGDGFLRARSSHFHVKIRCSSLFIIQWHSGCVQNGLTAGFYVLKSTKSFTCGYQSQFLRKALVNETIQPMFSP